MPLASLVSDSLAMTCPHGSSIGGLPSVACSLLTGHAKIEWNRYCEGSGISTCEVRQQHQSQLFESVCETAPLDGGVENVPAARPSRSTPSSSPSSPPSLSGSSPTLLHPPHPSPRSMDSPSAAPGSGGSTPRTVPAASPSVAEACPARRRTARTRCTGWRRESSGAWRTGGRGASRGGPGSSAAEQWSTGERSGCRRRAGPPRPLVTVHQRWWHEEGEAWQRR